LLPSRLAIQIAGPRSNTIGGGDPATAQKATQQDKIDPAARVLFMATTLGDEHAPKQG
jgi:hypothetical protein